MFNCINELFFLIDNLGLPKLEWGKLNVNALNAKKFYNIKQVS